MEVRSQHNIGGAMARHLWGTVVILLVLGAPPGCRPRFAQVSGRVTNEQTGQGVCRGDDLGHRHPDRGPDRRPTAASPSTCPDGDADPRGPGDRLQARHGHRPGDADERCSVALEPDLFKLEEVVVTGQSTGIERQNLPNAVATVSASELTRAPTGDPRERAAGQDPRRPDPGQLRRARRRHPGEPARRLHHQRRASTRSS